MLYCLLTSDMIKYKMLDSNSETNKDFNASNYVVAYKIKGSFESRIKFERCQKGLFYIEKGKQPKYEEKFNYKCRKLACSLCIKVIVTSLA